MTFEDDPGEALFLTPYLEQDKIDEARRLRLVSNFISILIHTMFLLLAPLNCLPLHSHPFPAI